MQWKDPPFLMGKSTISTGPFSIATVSSPEGTTSTWLNSTWLNGLNDSRFFVSSCLIPFAHLASGGNLHCHQIGCSLLGNSWNGQWFFTTETDTAETQKGSYFRAAFWHHVLQVLNALWYAPMTEVWFFFPSSRESHWVIFDELR